MNYQDFMEYMQENLTSYTFFMEKAKNFQLEKNKVRAAKAKWNEAKVERATSQMWTQGMDTLYGQLKTQIGIPALNGTQKWIAFIEENEVIENVNEGLSEVEFE